MGGLFKGGAIGKMFGRVKAHQDSGAGRTSASSEFFEGSTQHTGVDLSERQQAVAPPGTIEGTPAGRRRRGRRGLGGPRAGLAAQTVLSNTY